TITARGSNLKIFGGKGKDSIKMFGTNQTVSGGAGADIFIYAASGGKEKITDFSANDTLKIGADGDGTYSTVTSGSDVIVSTDDGGQITLVGAAGESLKIAGTKKSSGAGVKVSSNGRKITLTSDFTDSIFTLSGKYSSAVTLTAADVLRNVDITGNEFANRITGSSQDDKIDGGKGRDNLHGGDGADVFIYKPNEGTDRIMDYQSGDLLTILDATFTKSSFKDDKLTLTIDGGGKIIFENVASGDKININGTSYSIRNEKLVIRN
ncbi:MAG: hypothetical protein IJR52_10295, partial [Selenomonadaceae bacterium]|nr:hypothetical protein [Selenomonadaceae bacterium]